MKSDEGQTRRGSKPEDALDFEELYKEFASRIRGLATRRLSDPHLAEDVVQETLIKAYKYQSARDKERQVWPWLWKIASNACSDLLSGSRTPEYPTPDVEEASRPDTAKAAPGPEELYFKAERLKVTIAALAALPPRYRRILLLKHAEGWSSGDIAGLEATSVDSVDSILKRARHQFRESYAKLAQEKGLPKSPFAKRRDGSTIGGLLVPGFFTEAFVRFRLKIREVNGRIGQWLNDTGHLLPIMGGRVDSVLAVSVAIAIGLGGLASTVATPSSGFPATMAASPEPQMVLGQRHAAASSKDASAGPRAPLAPSDVVEIVEHETEEFGLDPMQEETPEDANFTSVAVSPNYENDHTVFAAGSSPTGPLLFVTRDGGANWVRQPAIGFLNSFRLMLPQSYPQDDRIFSASLTGLYESRDGGLTFHPLLLIPLDGKGAEISPNFGKGDFWFLLSTAAGIVQYDSNLNSIRPNPLPLPLDGTLHSLAILPSPVEPIVLVSISRRQKYGDYFYDERFPYRCQNGACQKVDSYREIFSGKFKYSPRFKEDGTVYLVGGMNLYISSDRGTNFSRLPTPKSDLGFSICCYDLVALSATPFSASSLIGVGGDSGRSRVYRSLDTGNSWGSSAIDSRGFSDPDRDGFSRLDAAPTGRIFASGLKPGIICSEDGGITWARRCPPEQ